VIKIHDGDRVTVDGIPGTHTVREVIPASEAVPHAFCRLVLGQSYGRRVIGEVIGLEVWRCKRVPVDLEDKPA
jgi:hypothetical protein